MTKYDLVEYMANLLMIFDHHESLGTTKSSVLLSEFEGAQKELIEMIQKEKDDEARKSQPQQRGGDQAGANIPRSTASVSGEARHDAGQPLGHRHT